MNEPKLRFKANDGSQFSDWEEKKLNEIVVRVTRKNKDNVTDIPLTISSVDGLIDQRNFFNKVVASKDMSGYYLLKNGEFAYNKSYSKGYDFGSIKRLDLYDEGALSTLYICFALNKNENSDFYQKYFDSLSWYPELQKICAEGARNHGLLNVPTNDFFQLKLCVPSSDKEQQKIAEFLSTIDTVIEKQKETVSAWEERKKGVMQKLFSQEVRFKADDGSNFPEWEEKKLGEVGDIVTGNTPSTKQNDYYGECYLWVTPADITDSREVTSTAKMLTELGYTVARHIPANSILVTCIASIGKNAILRENGSCNQQINSITPYDEYSVEFVYYLICQNEKLLHANAGTGGMEILNKENFSKIKMYFPCFAEQQKIADCLSSLDEVIEKQKATLSAWEELKKGLLQQMFV